MSKKSAVCFIISNILGYGSLILIMVNVANLPIVLFTGFASYCFGVAGRYMEDEHELAQHRGWLEGLFVGLVLSFVAFVVVVGKDSGSGLEILAVFMYIAIVAILTFVIAKTVKARNDKEREQNRLLDELKQQRSNALRQTDKKTRVLPRADAIVPKGGWQCTCGRGHYPYESGCVCGKTKDQAKMPEVREQPREIVAPKTEPAAYKKRNTTPVQHNKSRKKHDPPKKKNTVYRTSKQIIQHHNAQQAHLSSRQKASGAPTPASGAISWSSAIEGCLHVDYGVLTPLPKLYAANTGYFFRCRSQFGQSEMYEIWRSEENQYYIFYGGIGNAGIGFFLYPIDFLPEKSKLQDLTWYGQFFSSLPPDYDGGIDPALSKSAYNWVSANLGYGQFDETNCHCCGKTVSQWWYYNGRYCRDCWDQMETEMRSVSLRREFKGKMIMLFEYGDSQSQDRTTQVYIDPKTGKLYTQVAIMRETGIDYVNKMQMSYEQYKTVAKGKFSGLTRNNWQQWLAQQQENTTKDDEVKP